MRRILKYLCLSLSVSCVVNPALAQDTLSVVDNFEAAYLKRITQEQINGVYIPRNLDDALAELMRLTDRESQQRYVSVPEKAAVEKLFFSFGRWIGHNWQFYEGSRFSHYLRSAGVTYPDDMIRFTMIAFHRHLRQEKIDLRDLITQIREERDAAERARKLRGEILHEETRTRTPEPAVDKQ